MAKTRGQSAKRKREKIDSTSSLTDAAAPTLKKSKKLNADKKFRTKRKAVKTEGESKLLENEIGSKAVGNLKETTDVKVELNANEKKTVHGIKCELKEECVATLSHKEKIFVGAHVSISGGLERSPSYAADIGARAFALFLRNQRTWNCKPMKDDVPAKFMEACEKFGFPPSMIVPHGSYLLNCGAPNPETLEKSREALVDELKRCELLGLTKYNFHPGSTCGKISINECLDKIAESIDLAHSATKYCTTLIENMSCQGNTVGGKFEELRGIIDRVKDKNRIGVCLDTCHAMAAGYDLGTKHGFDQMMDDFDRIVGFKYLQAIHLNDSKGEAGCRLDRHENIGRGKIGKEGFRRIMEDPRLENIPMVLETPLELDDEKEIKILYSLCE